MGYTETTTPGISELSGFRSMKFMPMITILRAVDKRLDSRQSRKGPPGQSEEVCLELILR